MIATATQPAVPEPDTVPEPTPPEQAKELAIRQLIGFVLYGKPRRAIAAFRALTLLCEFCPETHARIVELSRTGRPAIAAAAASALVQATLARRRYRDGRSPLLHL
jgi:hypothetical protein